MTLATQAVRRAVRNILGPRLTAVMRRPFRPALPSLAEYSTRLTSKRGLEIGGPSALFASDGPIPVYNVLEGLDNCLYSANTIWTGEVQKGSTFLYHPAKPAGKQIIAEATSLQCIQDRTYECILACHCLEHIANPLRALAEWKRVLKDDGLLLIVLPHKDGTFDWRRPATSLDHMISDLEQGTGEDDLTHLPEVLDLHDLSRDEAAGDKEKFLQRCLKNPCNRAMHHHVFDMRTVLATIDYSGLQIVRVDTLKPFHIVVLAHRTSRKAENEPFMNSTAEHWRRSSFPSDGVPKHR